MSEYQRANSFGTGYLEMDSVFVMKIENKSKKQFFEVAGDDKALKAFGELGNDLVSYHYDNSEKKTIGIDGKDYFIIELTSPPTKTNPNKEKMMKIVDFKTYMKLISKYHLVSEGKWKEWRQVDGKPRATRVQN